LVDKNLQVETMPSCEIWRRTV